MNESLIEMRMDLSSPGKGSNLTPPKISVIVPVYKVEKYLPECIESVLAQTFTDFELILVDDGSPDNSGKICDDYAARDSRIRVFHKENGGVSSARNLGLDNARGEWIAFIDSDDIVGSKYLECLWGGTSNMLGPNPETLVVSGLTYLDEEGHEIRSLIFPEGERLVKEAFREEQLYRFGYPVSKLYDGTIIRHKCLRFDSEISMSEDTLFMGDYLRNATSIIFRNDHLNYKYWIRTGSLSQQYSAFESEFKFFLRSRKMFSDLSGSKLISKEQEFLQSSFFRALSCLYRPIVPSRKERLEKLKCAHSMLLGGEFRYADLPLRRRIFIKKYFVIFDAIERILFYLRYGMLKPFWRTYCAWNRKSPV